MLLTLTLAALVQVCPVREGGTERSDAARLKFLQSELGAEAKRLHTWRFAWGATYGVLTLGQLVPVPLILEADKLEWYWGAGTTAVGLAWILIDPPELLEAGPRFATKAAEGDGVCALIAEGEALLEQSAAYERSCQRWYNHALNVAFNVGIGLVLGAGYGHWVAGAVNFGLGVVLGELTIFTTPKRLVSAWAEYQRGALGEASSPVAVSWFPMVRPDGAGLGVTVSF